MSLLGTTVQLLQMNVRAALFTAAGCALVTHARNYVVSEFLSRPEKTHILFADADMEWQPQTIARMLAFNVPFAAVAYPNKVYVPQEGPIAKGWEEARAAALRWHVQFDDPRISAGEIKPAEVRGFAKATRVGSGLMLLRRDMIETMITRYADTRYSWRNVDEMSEHYGLFEVLKNEDGELCGEDYAFCDRWVKGCGGEIWIDLDAPIVHHGHHSFRGVLRNELTLRAARRNGD